MSETISHNEKKSILVPELRFKEFGGEWKFTSLGSLAELTSSKRVYLSDYVSEGIPFFRGKEISELKQGIIPNDILYISDKAYEEFKTKYGVPLRDDILMTAVGTLGNVLRITNDNKFYFKDGNLIWFRNIKSNSEFLEVAFQAYLNEVLKTAIGSSQKALTMVELRKLKLPFPSLPEQQKIASFLSSVDEKIQQLTRKKELLEDYKKGVMQQTFSQQIRFKDENGNDFPEWEEKTFVSVAKFINGRAYKQEELLSVGKYPVLRVGNLFSNNEWYYSDLELEEDKYIENGDLIYAWSATFGPRFWIGEKTIYHYHIWKVLPNKQVDKYFLYHAFMYDVDKIKSQSQGGTMVHITKGNIEKRKFLFPCVGEQKLIGQYLNRLDKKIDQATEQLTQTQTFKKGLLQKMFV